MHLLNRILRANEVIASKINIQVINRLLENVAIHLVKGSSQRFGLAHHLTDRRLQQTRFDRAVDSHKLAQLPLRAEATRSSPSHISSCTRVSAKCAVIKLHPMPPTKPGLPNQPRSPASLCYKLFRPYISPVLFDVVQTRALARLLAGTPTRPPTVCVAPPRRPTRKRCHRRRTD